MAQWAGGENKRYPIGIPLLEKVKIGVGTGFMLAGVAAPRAPVHHAKKTRQGEDQ
jgi:hypothetical protein